eukprot:312985-Prorocentrum_minimum.AAC.1
MPRPWRTLAAQAQVEDLQRQLAEAGPKARAPSGVDLVDGGGGAGGSAAARAERAERELAEAERRAERQAERQRALERQLATAERQLATTGGAAGREPPGAAGHDLVLEQVQYSHPYNRWYVRAPVRFRSLPSNFGYS